MFQLLLLVFIQDESNSLSVLRTGCEAKTKSDLDGMVNQTASVSFIV